MATHKQKPYLTYALDVNGKLMHVSEVLKGLECNCFCPHCKNKLIAKNGGSYKIPHFAHANGSDCVGAKESALHKMAKDILYEHKLIMLPPTQKDEAGKQILFKKIETEILYKELSLRPDCIGYTENNHIIWIEFKRSHEVDVKKAGKIISAKIDCIEIDLSSCELDPVNVKTFIESNKEMRKWIYNHENPHTYQNHERSNYDQLQNFDDDYYFSQEMIRHIAIDEQNILINLYNLDEIDVNNHTYYCIACGKEVFIDVDSWGDYSFLHLDKKTPCEDNFYLHEAAKKILYTRFNTQQYFNVYIPQQQFCENRQQCKLYNEDFCSAEIPVLYDLKAYGYDSCEIEYKFPKEQFPYDAVLKRGNDLKAAIAIIIDADTCHIEPQNLKNRAIEISVRRENDILNLYREPLQGVNFKFLNFKHKSLITTSYKNINRKVLKFTLFSSGKYYFGTESCMNTKKTSAIYEIIISQDTGNYKEMKQYAILHCYNKQKVLCLCEICLYLKSVDRSIKHEKICIRYKTKKTPRNPLETMPIKCPYFNLNKNIKDIIEKEYRDLKFIENDLTNNSIYL